ncbi:hypothetical protein MMC25_000112 [Agyrium rufum]|nr:hypothetical protein [Agyrium rufum]
MSPAPQLRGPPSKGSVMHEPPLRLSRSPHPYHRRSLNQNSEILNDLRNPEKRRKEDTSAEGYGVPQSHLFLQPEHLEPTARNARKCSTSPSESGTEADDEGMGFLRSLPAAPVKPRKGLRDGSSLGGLNTPSPLLTPTFLESENRDFFEGTQSPSKRSPGGTRAGISGEELQKLKGKYTKRRNAELLRRIAETVSLLAIGVLTTSFEQRFCPLIACDDAMVCGLSPKRAMTCIGSSNAGLGVYLCLMLLLYSVALARLLRPMQLTRITGRPLKDILLPISFDPAPYLYPQFVPTLVALSLWAPHPEFLVPNLILSICTFPWPLIPHAVAFVTIPSFQLVLSVCLLRYHEYNLGLYVSTAYHEHLELLSYLPFLHAALISTLGFLTTTSLLPAELQLLSVTLINLLLFASSPQTVILKALLWLGGLCMLIFCRYPMKWTVAISRIPNWRFRRSYTQGRRHNRLLIAIDDILGGRLIKWLSPDAIDSSSDEMESSAIRMRRSRRPQKSMPSPINYALSGEPAQALRKAFTENFSMGERLPDRLASSTAMIKDRGHTPQRRNTLPTYSQGSTVEHPGKTKRSTSQSRTRASRARPNFFLTLSRAQAGLLKWSYAIYVYAVTIACIALPIHWYVRRFALRGNEPVGWALGYLLGELPSFRLWVVMTRFDSWIPLPPYADESIVITGPLHIVFSMHVGNANIRLLISLYCLAVIIVGLVTVMRLSPFAEVDTRRKVFHGMMVAMFLPTIFIDPTFVALALALILAIFLLLDLFRASQLPPISKPLAYFLAPYVDGRDHRGPVVVSHIFLLIGCSIPLWLSLAGTRHTGTDALEGWSVETRDISMVSGVICVGMGDAAASLIGRRYGRRRWIWSGGKSLEGSLAFSTAVVIGLMSARAWLLLGGWRGDSGDSWFVTLGKSVIAASGASFTEAVLTGGNDNVIVPIILWLLVRGLQL